MKPGILVFAWLWFARAQDNEERVIYINPSDILEFKNTGVLSQDDKYIWEPPVITVAFSPLSGKDIISMPFFPLLSPSWSKRTIDAITVVDGPRILVNSTAFLMTGQEGSKAYTSTVQTYNFDTDTLETHTKDAPFAVVDAAIAFDTQSRSIFVVGGTSKQNSVTDGFFAYSPDTKEWTIRAAFPVRLRRARAITLKRSGRIFVLGGYQSDTVPNLDVYVYENDAWRKHGTLPFGVSDACFVEVVLMGVSHIMFVGGQRISPPTGMLPTFYLYNTDTGMFTVVPLPGTLNLMRTHCFFNGLSIFAVGGLAMDGAGVLRYTKNSMEYRFTSEGKISKITPLTPLPDWYAGGLIFLQ